MSLENRVQFLGVRSDITELLKSVDFVVLSSHFEGLSLSCIEGLASGKPFIASDAPGLTEIVKDAGVLFPIGDEKSFTNKIIELSSNEKKHLDITSKCKKRAGDYDINLMVQNHIDLYKELFKQ